MSKKRVSEEVWIRMNKVIKVVIYFMVSIILILFVNIAVNSYINYQVDCGKLSQEEMQNIIILGEFNPNNQITTIHLEESSPLYKRTVVHEEMHERQYKLGILGDCSTPIRLYINELEANIYEEFWWLK